MACRRGRAGCGALVRVQTIIVYLRRRIGRFAESGPCRAGTNARYEDPPREEFIP